VSQQQLSTLTYVLPKMIFYHFFLLVRRFQTESDKHALGFLYCNGASASSDAVADMALLHIFAALRNLQWSMNSARFCSTTEWFDAHSNGTFTTHNPQGYTIGIVGLDNIGYTIPQKAYAAFGAKIVYNDVYRKSPEQEAVLVS
jgi:lactate dehydrogenase-like 2-hydroxyacid dehydrogenase